MKLNIFETNLEKFVNFNVLKASIPFFLVFILLEIVYAYFHKKKIRLNNTINNLSAGLIQQITGILALNSLTSFFYLLLQNHYTLLDFKSLNSTQKILSLIILFFLVDFFYYLFHMCSHKVNIFWAAHIVHHQSEDYNLSTALRQSSFQACYSWLFYLPIAAIGFPFKWFITMKSLNLIYQFWIHTEFIKKLPSTIEFIFNTPSHHRVHHGSNIKYLDKNHGGILIIWDRIFGTFQEEDETVIYGITSGFKSWNPIWAQCHYFLYLLKKSFHYKKTIDKLQIFLKPPGWKPSKYQNNHQIKEISETKKYNPLLDKNNKFIACVFFFMSFVFSYAFTSNLNKPILSFLFAIVVLFFLYLTGKALENRLIKKNQIS